MTSLQLPHEAIKHNRTQVPNESIIAEAAGGRNRQPVSYTLSSLFGVPN